MAKTKNSDADRYKLDVPDDLKLPPAQVMQKPDLSALEERRIEINKKLRELLDSIKSKAEGFRKEVISKFSKKILGILLMPPKPASICPKCGGQNVKTSDNLKNGHCNACKHKWELLDILVLLRLEDEDKKKRFEIEKKLREIGSKKLPDLKISVALLDEIWDMCVKGKYDIVSLIAMGMPIHDDGWISTLRSIEIHKSMVLKKFEKYVVTYIVAGSMIRGEARAESDIDVYVVIDDTDVTRMSTGELIAKLRSIVGSMAWEAKSAANSKTFLHPQVWILTDMWDSLRGANPVIYTVLRDGVPFYDRGMFAPWKLLLQKGKITPTPEAIEMHMKTGKSMLDRIKFKLKDMALDDFFWATFTPSQGALMLIGVAPPDPRQTVELMREHFVKKGLLEEEYVKILDDILKLRKAVEHGEIKEVSGKDVADTLDKSEKYLKRLDKLLKLLEVSQTKKEIGQLYDEAVEDAIAALHMVDVKATEKDVIELVQKELVDKKLASAKYADTLKRISDLKEKGKFDMKTLASLAFEQDRLARDTFDLIRAKKGKRIESYKISANYSGKKADVWFLSDSAYIVMDTAKPTTEIKKFRIEKDGSLADEKKSDLKELNDVLKKFVGKPTTLTKHTIESLKKILADDVQLAVGA